jgi:predicted nucleotidyltransferase
MQPTPEQLNELVQRIVTTVHPLRVILFGSAARGEMGLDSDLDVLVVMPDGTHRRHTAELLHQQFFGIPYGIDVVVATPADLDKYRHSVGLIYRTILEEGRELYAA